MKKVALALYCLILLGPTPAFARLQSEKPPNPVGPQLPSPPAPSATATVVLNDFARACAGITSYTATVTLFEQQGDRTQDAVFDYTFRKPSNASAYEAKGRNAGVTLVWDGGDTVVAHRSGFLSFLKKTLSLHDPLATTIRGSSIDELSFSAILLHAEQVNGTLSVAPGETIAGMPTEAVTLVPASPVADGGLTREILELSPSTHLPVRVTGYVDTQLVRKVDFSNVKVQAAAITNVTAEMLHRRRDRKERDA